MNPNGGENLVLPIIAAIFTIFIIGAAFGALRSKLENLTTRVSRIEVLLIDLRNKLDKK